MSQLLSVDHAAERLRLQPRTIRNYIRSGRLRATRIGKQYRIRLDDLELLERGGTVAAAVGDEAEPGASSTEATVVVRIDTGSPALQRRVSGLANSAGFAAGTSAVVVSERGPTELRIISTGPLAATIDLLTSISHAVESARHD